MRYRFIISLFVAVFALAASAQTRDLKGSIRAGGQVFWLFALTAILLCNIKAGAQTEPTTKPASALRDPVDGAFDISPFLTSREGFLRSSF